MRSVGETAADWVNVNCCHKRAHRYGMKFSSSGSGPMLGTSNSGPGPSEAMTKSDHKRLAQQDCHPERSEGSRGQILRYAQNDIVGGLRRKVYQCHAFRFRSPSEA